MFCFVANALRPSSLSESTTKQTDKSNPNHAELNHTKPNQSNPFNQSSQSKNQHSSTRGPKSSCFSQSGVLGPTHARLRSARGFWCNAKCQSFDKNSSTEKEEKNRAKDTPHHTQHTTQRTLDSPLNTTQQRAPNTPRARRTFPIEIHHTHHAAPRHIRILAQWK